MGVEGKNLFDNHGVRHVVIDGANLDILFFSEE